MATEQTQDQNQQNQPAKPKFAGIRDMFAPKNKDLMSEFKDKKLLGVFGTLSKTLFDFTKEVKKFNLINNKISYDKKKDPNAQIIKELKEINRIENENTKLLKKGFMQKVGGVLGFIGGIVEFAAIAGLLATFLTTDNKFVKPIREGLFWFVQKMGDWIKDGVEWWWEQGGGKTFATETIPKFFGDAVKGAWEWYDKDGKSQLLGLIKGISTGLWDAFSKHPVEFLGAGFGAMLLSGNMGAFFSGINALTNIISKFGLAGGVYAALAVADIVAIGKIIEAIAALKDWNKSEVNAGEMKMKHGAYTQKRSMLEDFKKKGFSQEEAKFLSDVLGGKEFTDRNSADYAEVRKIFAAHGKGKKETEQEIANRVFGGSDIKEMIKRHEGGYKREIYSDTLGNQTIGYGHLVKKGETFIGGVSVSEAEKIFENDYNNTLALLNKRFPGFNKLNQNEQAAIIDMTYNMGPDWFTPGSKKYWRKLVNAITSRDSDKIISAIRPSLYSRQVGTRAEENIALLTGQQVKLTTKTAADATATNEPKKSFIESIQETGMNALRASVGGLKEANEWLVSNTPGNLPNGKMPSSVEEDAMNDPSVQFAKKQAEFFADALVAKLNNGRGGTTQQLVMAFSR